MECESRAESLSVEDGVVQIAFDLTGSPAAYLIICRPLSATAGADFFGEGHYVEVRDQLYGRYGAIETLRITDVHRFNVRLKLSIPDIGAGLTIVTRSPMSDALITELRALERP